MSAAAERIAVDIVVNNYNYGAYVGDAVDSALGQDHPDVRVIVVDDGSTDDSRERLSRYDGSIELVLKRNEGQWSAYNAGFARCTGDLIVFLDADDTLAPNAASQVARAFLAARDAVRVEFRMGVMDGSGRALGRTKPPDCQPLLSGDLRHAALAFPFDMNLAPGTAHAYNRTALERIMPIPDIAYGSWGADYYMLHLTNLLGPVTAADEVCAYYRVHGQNAFEHSAPVLDLGRIRREIAYQRTTAAALLRLADELELPRPERILSISNISLRVISLKLDPANHLPADRYGPLMADAVRAARRRADTPPLKRLMLLAMLGAIAAAPRPMARRLAELLVFPELRPQIARRRDDPEPNWWLA